MHRPTRSMASESPVDAALRADPTAKMAAPTEMLYFRLILSAMLPASMPVKAEGSKIICERRNQVKGKTGIWKRQVLTATTTPRMVGVNTPNCSSNECISVMAPML